MISLTSVTKKFGSKTAVKKISLQASGGDIIGFLGPNGAGKTTTMRMILGYLHVTSGRITVQGLDPVVDRIRILRKIGYLPENNPLYQEMKVEEYLKFVCEVKKIPSNEVSVLAEEIGLSDVLKTKIETLSRGYKQRVGLAAALIGDPEILVLDEPTSGLDPIEQDRIRLFIKKIATKKTIIFSTHILSEVEDIANRLVIIDKGEIVYDGLKPEGRGSVEELFKKLVKKHSEESFSK